MPDARRWTGGLPSSSGKRLGAGFPNPDQVAASLSLGFLALQDVSVKSVVQKGLGDQARLVMVVHPVLESRFAAAMGMIAGLDVMRAPPRAIRVLEEEFG